MLTNDVISFEQPDPEAQEKKAKFVNSVDQDELPHLNLHCLPSSL